jgi:hypothetical protein
MRQHNFTLASLALALIGFWMPWLTHPAAALRMNGYELSEWVTFLPGVRDGSLPFNRLSFLIPIASLALLFAIAAARARPENVRTRRRPWMIALLPTSPLGWGLLFLSLLCSVIIFPPYPYLLTAYADPEFRLQFIIACATILSIGLILYLPDETFGDVLQIFLALLGGGYAGWTALALWRVLLELFHIRWALGLGWALILWGFAGLVLSGWTRVFGPRA